MNRLFVLGLLPTVLLTPLLAAAEPELPAAWLAAWKNPPLADRPLQIVHGIDRASPLPDGIGQMLPGQGPQKAAQAGMQFYKDRGLGGIVCNVAFDKYLESEEHWKALAAGVEACKQLGMVVWLYDEKGYPSGAAGGLVLRENGGFEAKELAHDPARPDPFVIRPAYEFTHASNNYHAARRYINLLDDRAVRSFVRHTHEAYFQRLGPYFGSTIQATFTDEPSLIAVNLGQIPENVRAKVPVVDPSDPAVKALAAVPWCDDLPALFRQRYGVELNVHRKSLFTGDTDEDRKVRRHFWNLIADLVAQRYFGTLQGWCSAHRVASSGHTLWEESFMHHPALEGNAIQCLSRMDIPGLDVLSSDPSAVIHSGWMTAGLPSSAALLVGRRRVMTEVSDFSQKMGGQGPASLAAMQATAGWQAAWGVTEFTLYYGIGDRPASEHRAYCDTVGRLNAILKPARFDPEVLLYYPVFDLWAEYKPVAEPLNLASQSPRAQRIVQSFMRLGQTLQRSQIPFAVVDHEFLGKATVPPEGGLEMGGHRFRAVVLPEGIELPPAAAKVVGQFEHRRGRVLRDKPDRRIGKPSLDKELPSHLRLTPSSEEIAFGQFLRDGRRIAILVNVGRRPWSGCLEDDARRDWLAMDPASGSIGPARPRSLGKTEISVAPQRALLLVELPNRP